MKRILIILSLSILTIFNVNQQINANYIAGNVYIPGIIGTNNGNALTKIVSVSNGSTVWNVNTISKVQSMVVDFLGNPIIGLENGHINKYDPNGNLLWTNTSATSRVHDLDVLTDNSIISYSFDDRLRRFNSLGQLTHISGTINSFTQSNVIIKTDANDNIFALTQERTRLTSYSSTFATNFQITGIDIAGYTTQDMHVEREGNIYILYSRSSDSIVRVYNKNLVLQQTINYNIGNLRGIATSPLDGNIYLLPDINNYYISDLNGSIIQTISIPAQTGTNTRIQVNSSNEVLIIDSTNFARIFRFGSNNNYIGFTDLDFVFNTTLKYMQAQIPEPPEYNVNISSNFSDFGDFIYIDNTTNITTTSINKQILNDEPWSISSSQINISPFAFNFWFDVDNSTVFNTNRTFEILNPNRDYTLVANFSLINSIDLTLNSNLPSPPVFNITTRSIENNPINLSLNPNNTRFIPFGYEFIIKAPNDNVGFYEFDYWYDNLNETIFTTSAIVTLEAFNDFNLTAIYSLPDEYRIDLVLNTPIGFIIFQHGILPPITGTTISVSVGEGDKWTVTAPLDPNYLFINWTDGFTQDIVSSNRIFSVNNTNRNYFLSGNYVELVTINWDSQGGTLIQSQKIQIGDSINKPNDPIRPSFQFGGWALPSAPNTPIIFPQSITSNITYQAIWLPTYQLTFNVNGGQILPSQTIIENNLPTIVTPSRFGYTFEGWFTDNITFNNPFDFNQPFTSNTTIHAQWSFGTTSNAESSLQSFLSNSGLDNPIAQWIIVLAFFILLNVMIYIYKGPFIVTVTLNFILTALFIVFGFIPIWITIVLFMAIFGFMILMLTGGRS